MFDDKQEKIKNAKYNTVMNLSLDTLSSLQLFHQTSIAFLNNSFYECKVLKKVIFSETFNVGFQINSSNLYYFVFTTFLQTVGFISFFTSIYIYIYIYFSLRKNNETNHKGL